MCSKLVRLLPTLRTYSIMSNRYLSQSGPTLAWIILCLIGISSPSANAQVPPLPASSAAAAPAETAYTLGAVDGSQVTIFKVPQYSGESEVSVDGTLNLSLIGPVNVAGLTIEAATALLSTRYAQ